MNFHLITTPSWGINGSERIQRLSHEIKALAINEDITIVSTVELKKIGKDERANNEDLSGSNSLQYDSNGITHLSSPLDKDPSTTMFFYHDSPYWSQKMAIIELNTTKNKIGSFKGLQYAKLYGPQSYYEFIDQVELNALKEHNRLALVGDTNF